jgi:predicted nucleotide-binding protein
MAKRKSTFRGNLPAPSLNIPRTDAESKIYDRVTSGNKLLGLSIHGEQDLEAAKAQRKKWNDYNEELLKQLFSSEVVLEDYNRSSMSDPSMMKVSWAQKISIFYEGIYNKIEALESIIKRLEFIPEKIVTSETQEKNKHRIPEPVPVVHGKDDGTDKSTTEKPESIPKKVIISKAQERHEPEISEPVSVVHGKDDGTDKSTTEKPESIPKKVIISKAQERYEPEISEPVSVVHAKDDGTDESKTEKPEFIPKKVIISKARERHEPEISEPVFVVHGHDDKSKVSVVRFIEKLGLKAVILNEQANAGQTIIEKFERNAAISGYAVIILTPDDMGALKENPDDATLRARQNVILGLGYFFGALGRAKVSVLVKEGAEILCDDLGVAYTLMDPEGAWQLSMARDMKSAGLSFDANRIF